MALLSSKKSSARAGRRHLLLGLGLSAAIAAAPPAAAVSPIEPKSSPSLSRAYQECMRQVARNPREAATFANNWRARGGGEAAMHCQAAADFALGDYSGAAALLDALAGANDLTQPHRGVTLYRQAARAWMAARHLDRALVSMAHGLALAPDDVDLYIERAHILVEQERVREAIDDLDRAIERDANRVDAFIFRATALRRLRALANAESDLDHALTLAPENVEALLERGVVRRLRGDVGGARQDWEAIASLAPKTAVSEAAKTYLLELEQLPGGR